MREELVLTFGGPVGSRRSTTDRASAYQLEPMPNLPPELRRRDTYCEWYDLTTSATTVLSRVTGVADLRFRSIWLSAREQRVCVY
jgi:hypothetical protein